MVRMGSVLLRKATAWMLLLDIGALTGLCMIWMGMISSSGTMSGSIGKEERQDWEKFAFSCDGRFGRGVQMWWLVGSNPSRCFSLQKLQPFFITYDSLILVAI